jgi:hypothetical protein
MKAILNDMKRKSHLRPSYRLGMLELTADVMLRTALIGHISSSEFSSNLRAGRGHALFFSLMQAYVDYAKRGGVVITMQYHWCRIKCIHAFGDKQIGASLRFRVISTDAIIASNCFQEYTFHMCERLY